MLEVLKQISDIGIVPVIKIDRVEDAIPLAKALIDGGLPCAEITFRTSAARDSIKAISEKYPQMLVGAGTVLTKQQADEAMAAGAKFIVSPGLNPEIVKHCNKKGYPIAPGVSNASDVEVALSLGLEVVKFFPAESTGGLPMIKSLAAPYTNMKFMPTGGINAKNLNSYLNFPKIIACGGSWMVNADMINAGDFKGIKQLTKEAVTQMLGFELAHIGINQENESTALATAKLFETAFGFNNKIGNSSIFAATSIEVMKVQGRGKNGHIAIRTNYINRAVRYLAMNGIKFDESSKKYNDKGQLTLIYLDQDFGGFDLHLIQK